MAALTRRKLQLALLFGIALVGGLLFLFVLGPWSPASRARALTLTTTQELYHMPPFTILDQETEERVDLNGCSINQITLRIGAPVSLSESTPLFIDAVQQIGWTRQPGNYAGIYYFQRAPGESLVLYTENIGPRQWQEESDTAHYAAFLYVVVANGTTYLGPCDHF